MLRIISLLYRPPPVGFIDRPLHGIGDMVGIHDDLAVDIARRPANRLDQRRIRTQESFLVGIENPDQGYLRQIESFPQQIDANEYIKITGA